MKRVAIYIRVSSEEQVKEGYSISAQRNRLTSYADSMEWDIYDLYIDEGVSGAKTDRPELNRLRDDIDKNLFDLVLVWKVDRFFRSVYYLSEILHNMEQHNIGFVSMTESFNTATPSGKAMLQMLAIFAEFERETIRERVIENLAERARQGLHHGPVPYGYERDNNKNLIPIPEQAEVVKRIFELRAKGKSYNQIRSDIEKLFLDRLHTNDSGTIFHFVARMLTNPVYKGNIIHQGKELPGKHEAIVDDELFQLVRARDGVRHDSYSYLFHGMMYCGQCGARMTSKFKHYYNGKSKVYYCPNSPARYKVKGNHTCNGRSISEKIILDLLIDYLHNFEIVIHEDTEQSKTDYQKEIQKIDKKISDLRKRKSRYFRMFEDDPDFEEEAKERIKELTVSIREWESQKNELESVLSESVAAEAVDQDELRNTAKELGTLLEMARDNDDEELISENVRLFFEKIMVHRIEGAKVAPGRPGSYIEPVWIQDTM